MHLTSIRVEGGLLSPDFLEAIHETAGQKPQDFGLKPRDSLVDEVSAIWGDARAYWEAYQRRVSRAQSGRGESVTTITREQWVLPLLEALGYTLTYQRRAVEVDGRSYTISHRASSDDDGPPVHIVASDQDLGDRPPSGRGTLSPHALLQDYLNRTDEHLWGIVTNGRILRLLRDSTYFTRPAYIEFDLQAMLDGERLDEFFLLYRLAHRSRLPRADERPSDCLLEQYYQLTLEQGGRIRDGLRQAVADAIVTFANGFLRHPRNTDLRQRIADGRLTADGLYQQLLYLIYRLLFLMVAEERNLLEIDKVTGGHGDTVTEVTPSPPHPVTRSSFYRQYVSISRLRALADTPLSAPQRFDDLYLGLRTLFFALHDETLAARLNIPALNGELFSNEKASDLDAAHLNNRDLLHAIRLLSYFTPPDEKVRRRVNYAALDVEELGSVYESLLDEQPVLDTVTRWQGDKVKDVTLSPPHLVTFSFISGTTRKTTGSYYTPRELVNEVIKSALVPVIEDRLTPSPAHPLTSSQKETVLLSLRVCDPACGSGHFLLAAARRIGYELAKVRSEADEPSPRQIREATRDAITHCIYGVDKNPLAVDLCKVALWIEGYSRGKPLTFLDYRVRCGDSLVGVLDLALLDDGIPDDAYQPVSGDDGQVARSLRDQNKEERGGQTSLFDQLSGAATAPDAAEWQKMETMPEETPAQVNAKRATYQRLQQRADRLRTAANLWTAAFFSPFTAENRATVPTSNTLRRWRQGQSVSQQVVGTANGMAAENRFFHWRLEFPQVFNGGGFDVVLGNPPWERIKLQDKEFFASRDPNIVVAPNKAARDTLIRDLIQNKPLLWHEYQNARHYSDCLGKYIRLGPRFTLTGRGDVNTYAVFSELACDTINPKGYSGIIVPSGVATDDTTKYFFQYVMGKNRIVSLYSFFEIRLIFSDTDSRQPFCLLTLRGEESTWKGRPEFVFSARSVADLQDPRRRFHVDAEDINLLNPNTGTCPIFRTNADADLTKKIYGTAPVLVDEVNERNPWGAYYMRLIDLSDHSGYLRFPWEKQVSPDWNEPLYEAKLFSLLDHRFGTFEGTNKDEHVKGLPREVSLSEKQNPSFSVRPRYYLPRSLSDELFQKYPEHSSNWLLVWRDVTNATSERTCVVCAIPKVTASRKSPALGFRKTGKSSLLLANLSSLVFDYLAKQKISGNSLSYFIVKQLSVLTPESYADSSLLFIVPRITELTYTSWEVASFAVDIWQEADEPLRQTLRAQWEANRQATGGHPWPVSGEPWSVYGGQKPPFPPFKWDDDRRAHLRAELDAYYARLYGLTRDELRYIVDPEDIYGPDFPGETFRVLKEKEIKAYGEYRTQRLVLAAWDAQQAAIDSGEMMFEINDDKVTGGQGDKVKESHPVTLSPGHPVIKEEPTTLELKSPPTQPQAKPKPTRQPTLDIQPTLVTEFTPPQGGYAQRLKRVMALGQPKTQLELTELIAALGDENDNIRWLASSALSRLGNMPVVKLLAAYLATNPSPPARTEVVRVLETIAAASEDDGVKTAVRQALGQNSDPIANAAGRESEEKLASEETAEMHWSEESVTPEALRNLSVGEKIWLTDNRTKKAVNHTLHGLGFSSQQGSTYTEWRKGSVCYRVHHSVPGHAPYKRAIQRES